MKKLLIVCPHYENNHVSSFRISSIKNEFEMNDYIVDILTLGDFTELNDKVSFLNRSHFMNNFSHFNIVSNMYGFLSDYFSNYQKIMISMPNFKLIQLLDIIPCNCDVILDYRDQIDFEYHSRVSVYNNNPVKKFIAYIDNKYSYFVHSKIINRNIEKIIAISCVGKVAKDSFTHRISVRGPKILNIHNGFNACDTQIIGKNIPNNVGKGIINIGISGSIYDFRCSKDVGVLLEKISLVAENKNIKVEIRHWGLACERFLKLVNKFHNIYYVQLERMDRKEYLKQILNVDYVWLLCSDTIKWEPTTSVFDYILFQKPILYTGFKQNEAINVLNECNTKFITSDEDLKFDTNELLMNRNEIDFDKLEEYTRDHISKNLFKSV